MVTSNDLVLRRSRIESPARWARIRKPRDKWGEITRLIRDDFTGIYNWRSGAHPCHRQVQKMMRDPQGSRLLVQHLSARPKVRKLEIFWNKEHGETNGWVVRFTKIHRVFTKKWRVVLCATYLATFCVLHLPDRIRLHSVWSSGSVGGIYLNIFESGFSLRQSWQVWKLIGTSHMSQQRMKGFWRSLAVWAGEHVNEDLPAHVFFHHLEAIYPYRKQWEHTKHEIIGKTDLSVFADVSYPEWQMCLVRGDQFRTCMPMFNQSLVI